MPPKLRPQVRPALGATTPAHLSPCADAWSHGAAALEGRCARRVNRGGAVGCGSASQFWGSTAAPILQALPFTGRRVGNRHMQLPGSGARGWLVDIGSGPETHWYLRATLAARCCPVVYYL
jgi:hypothetical protein